MQNPPDPRKRILDPTALPPRKSRLRRRTSTELLPASIHPGECGRLITVDVKKGQVALVLLKNTKFTIGRAPNSDYETTRLAASANHCHLHSLTTDPGETIVLLTDHSSNGTMHNSRRLHQATVILVNGDQVEVAGQRFRYLHACERGREDTQSQAMTQLGESGGEKVGNYLVLPPLLGSGAFSIVYLGLNLSSLKQVACKKLRRKKLSQESYRHVLREVEILKRIRHPNINQVEDIVISDERVHIFLQLVTGGDLFSYLIKNTRLEASEAKFILYQLLSALVYLHGRGLSHRDIKLENIILDGAGPYPKALLGDFGHCDFATQDNVVIRGTLVYNPPEVLKAAVRHIGYASNPVDCWSLGIVLHMLLLGYHPFDESYSPRSDQFDSYSSSSSLRVHDLEEVDILLGESCLEDIGEDEKDLNTCRNVLRLRGRIEVVDVRELGSGDKEVRKLLGHMLDSNPATRYTASEALTSKWFRDSGSELLALYSSIVLGIKGVFIT